MIPIQDAVGRTIACPQPGCGARCTVAHAQNRVRPEAMQSEAIRTAALWFVVDCPVTGKKLHKHHTPVEVVES